MVTEEGFPLGYEVFAGNMHDSLTVKSVVESLERKHGALNRVWVMDRGMVSKDNLEFLRERGAKYIVGTPKAMLRQFERHLAEQNWVVAQEGVDVKLVPSPDGQETFLLARSIDRRSKELAMHEKFIGHMEAGLKKLKSAAESGRLRDERLASERLGRLKERFWRASQAFDVTIRKLPQPIGKQHLEVSWVCNEKFHEWSQLVDGCYLLRTNLTGVDPATLWKRYIQLTEAEWAFRIAKDELAIRPVWHQREDRVRSHVLICFLAYAMWKTLAGWMKGAGLGMRPHAPLRVRKDQKRRHRPAGRVSRRHPHHGALAARDGARSRAENAAAQARADTSQAAQAARQPRANVVKTLTPDPRESRALRSQVRNLLARHRPATDGLFTVQQRLRRCH